MGYYELTFDDDSVWDDLNRSEPMPRKAEDLKKSLAGMGLAENDGEQMTLLTSILNNKDRFLKGVLIFHDGCWMWTGFDPLFRMPGFPWTPVARVSFMLHHGRVLDKDEMLVNSCSSSLCISPEHLCVQKISLPSSCPTDTNWEKTAKKRMDDNLRDMFS